MIMNKQFIQRTSAFLNERLYFAPSLSSSSSIIQKRSVYVRAKLIDPIQEYNRQLRLKRKEYLESHRKKQLALAQEEQEQKEALRLQKELAIHQRQVKPSIDPLIDPEALKKEYGNKKTPVDHILRSSQSQNEQQDSAPVISEWRRMAQEDQKKRYQRFLVEEKQKSESRLESLLYLFYSASDFITYKNMDRKLDALLAMPSKSSSSTPSSETSSMIAGQNLSPEERTKIVEKREQVLEQILMGTLDGTHPDANTIQDMAKNSSN